MDYICAIVIQKLFELKMSYSTTYRILDGKCKGKTIGWIFWFKIFSEFFDKIFVLSMIKNGFSFDDEVLALAGLKKQVRDVHVGCDSVCDKAVVYNIKKDKKDAPSSSALFIDDEEDEEYSSNDEEVILMGSLIDEVDLTTHLNPVN